LTTVAYLLKLDEKLRRQLHLIAVSRGTSLKDVMIEALRKYVEEHIDEARRAIETLMP